MTQQPSKTALSPTFTVYSRPTRFLVVGLLAIMAFGLGNIIHSARHPPKRVPGVALHQPQEGARHNADR